MSRCPNLLWGNRPVPFPHTDQFPHGHFDPFRKRTTMVISLKNKTRRPSNRPRKDQQWTTINSSQNRNGDFNLWKKNLWTDSVFVYLHAFYMPFVFLFIGF
ncbi:hypothetical protein CDAR_22581 [Caerostris darwini]|uniref:Transmembrane protein n=1 Tax=Caerostris darwini TaxID=1538125 RepID=A0AAV4V9P9_9ARAC|nr:hypothetical protein CDAR_22581 [Caerostris darwini]